MTVNKASSEVPREGRCVDILNQGAWEPAPVFLKCALATLLAGTLAFMVVIHLMTPEQTSRYIGPGLGAVMALAAWALLRAGKPRLSVQFLAIGTWVLVTLIAFTQGGVRTPVLIAYPVIIMLIGWLFNARVTIAAGAMTVAVVLGLIASEVNGLLPARPATPAATYGVIQVLMTVLAVLMTNFVIRSYNNRLLELSNAALELTQRTHALELSQRNLDMAIESTRMVFWQYDMVNDYLSYDEATLGWLGLDAANAPHTLSTWLARVHPDDRKSFKAAFAQIAQTDLWSFDRDYRIRDSAGAWVWLHTRGTVVQRDSEGMAQMAGGGSLNITDRKQAQEDLRRGEALLRDTLESTEEGILMVSSTGRVLAVNKQFHTLWNLPNAAATGATNDALLAQVAQQLVDPLAFLDQIMRLHASEDQLRDTLRFKDGRVFARFTQALSVEGARSRIWCFRDITQASHTATTLVESQKLLQAVIDTVPVRVFWKDTALRYMGCNPAFARDAGLSEPHALIGKPDTELPWKNQAALYAADDRRVMTSGQPIHAQDELQTTPDGRLIWLRTSKVPLRNEADETIGVLGIYEDITERKHAEFALRESESRAQNLSNMLRLLCDNVPDMIWAKDLNKRYIFANKAVCSELLGATDTNEPLGKDDLFFAQRERSRFPDNAQWHSFGELCQDSDTLTLQNGKASRFDEYGNVRGEFMFLDVHKAPFLDARGEVIGVVGSARNVTQQKLAEDKLQLSAMVLERSSEAMMITDADNRILEVNPAFTRTTGYSRDEALGQSPVLLNSGRQGPEFYRAMWGALHSSGQWQGEIWNRRKDGQFIAEWLTINTLYANDGAVHRRVALFSDITEKKNADELMWVHANFDMLTQLPNRRMFHDRLTQEIKKAQRSGLMLALFFLDLDRFKEVNDTLGHQRGDILLVEAARRIKASVRESDTVARMGGDEFTVILPEIGELDSVERVAQGIVHALSQPFQIGTEVAHVSGSLGIALYPHDGSEADALLQAADQAMYAAKGAGRNGFRYSSDRH